MRSFGIGVKTFYNKLEWVYRRCLEFLERHETEKLQEIQIKNLWLDTDSMVYFLNNTKKKGHGDKRIFRKDEPQLNTDIVATGDTKTLYIFRADVAYDWTASLDDIERDTLFYKDDHLHDYARKNARLRFQYIPQPPTKNDTQSTSEFAIERRSFEIRESYVDGLHVN